jgi:U3 small nucleolar RNA-associated protein 5
LLCGGGAPLLQFNFSILHSNKVFTSIFLQGEHQRLVVLGSFTGVVRCYDAARAEVKWTAAGSVDGPIAAVATGSGKGAGSLLVVGKTGGAAILDLATGNVLSRWHASKHQLSAAALLPDGSALVAGSSLGLHDASSGAKLHKWTGHATPVTALVITPDGAFSCSTAQGERTIAVWSTATTAAGKLRHKSAVVQLNLEEQATSLSINSVSSDCFHVAAVTASGKLQVFECTVTDADSGAVARKWATSSASSGRILSAVVESADSKGINLVLATGLTAKPHFQHNRADLGAEGSTALTLIDVAGDGSESGLLLTSGKKGAATKGIDTSGATAAVVGADEGVVMAGKGGGKRGAAAAGMEGEEDNDNDDDDDVDSMEEDEGPTFAERIAALQGETAGDAARTAAAAVAPPTGPLKADSLAVLLSQALQSGDKVLLERCLTVRNDAVITKTVKRLAPTDAAIFLRVAVQRLQSAPARGEQLATWIRAVLLHHTAYLSGVAGAQGTLGYLYQLIEARLASYQPLLALSGRLDLVLANARRAAGTQDDDDDDDAYPGATGPLVTIEVGSDGGVEVEDAFADVGLSDDDDDDDSLDDYSEDEDEEGTQGEEEDDDGEESEEF